MSRLVITFICENRHEVETVSVDLTRRGEVNEEDIWRMRTKNSRYPKCGSDHMLYRTRYKE